MHQKELGKKERKSTHKQLIKEKHSKNWSPVITNMSLTQFCVLGASYPPLLMWHQFFFLLILLTTQGTETESHLDIHNLILDILRRNCSPKQHNVMPSTKEQRNFTDFCSQQSIWFSVPNHLKLQCWFSPFWHLTLAS